MVEGVEEVRVWEPWLKYIKSMSDEHIFYLMTET